VTQEEERCSEQSNRDDDPAALPERVVGVEPVDLRQAERGEQADDREQVRIGERNGVAGNEVRSDVDREEDPGIGERGRRDDVLPGDVDAGESNSRQDPDDDQEREFPVAQAQRRNLA
jgi:hypothetical protein